MKKRIQRLKRIVVLAILQSFVAGIVPAQETLKFPKTTAGERTEAYFKAFDSQDEGTMRKFFADNVDTESLKRRSIDARMEVHIELWAEMGKVEVKKINVVKENEISVTVKSSKAGFYKFDFGYAEKSPNKLVIFGVDEAQPVGESNQPTSVLSESDATKEIEKYLDSLLAKDEFSGVVLIAKNDKVILQKAYGLSSKEYNVPNRLDTKFNLGSINKIFTHIAIAQLQQQGKLSLDDFIGKYLLDYPNKIAAQKVTIRHLLNMTSGIGDFFGKKFEATPKDKIRSIKDYFQFFAGNALLFKPGAQRQYSNGGYIVLGAIIEKISGTDYYTYVRKNIFSPNRMANTDYYFADYPTPNLASGYSFDSQKKIRLNNMYTRPAIGSSAGGGYSTAEDLLKFAEALKNEKLQLAKLEPNQPEKFSGIGIAGGSKGINAVLEILPENSFTIIVLSNYDPPSAENIGRFIRSRLSATQSKENK